MNSLTSSLSWFVRSFKTIMSSPVEYVDFIMKSEEKPTTLENQFYSIGGYDGSYTIASDDKNKFYFAGSNPHLFLQKLEELTPSFPSLDEIYQEASKIICNEIQTSTNIQSTPCGINMSFQKGGKTVTIFMDNSYLHSNGERIGTFPEIEKIKVFLYKNL